MRRALFGCSLLLSLLLSLPVFAMDAKTEALTKTLKTDSNFKVRAKAAQILGKSGDADAIPALIEALKKDSEELVRAYAAQSLGLLAGTSGSADAQKALTAAASGDSSKAVRSEAENALSKFPAATPTPGGGYLVGDVFIQLGKFTNTSKVADPSLIKKFQSQLEVELSTSGKKASSPPKGKKTLTLDGSVQKVEAKSGGGATALTLGLSVTVTRDRSILAIVQKEATIEYDGKLSSREEVSGREELLETLIPETYKDVKKNLPKWK